jgi:cytochrome c553
MNKLVLIFISALALHASAFAADIAAGKTKAASCAACHGADGNGSPASPIWPKLAGQGTAYLIKQMEDFASKARIDPTMNGMIMSISSDDYANVAAYYASLPASHSAVADKYFELGQTLYRAGDAERKVTACSACHGPDGTGMAAAGFPSLSGQSPEYITKQLQMFRSNTRENDNNNVMRDVAKLMSDEQIEAIAHYVSGLH